MTSTRVGGSVPAGGELPHILREYALLADGERGVIVGPDGDFAWMCFPRWESRRGLLVPDRRVWLLPRDAHGVARCGAATTSRGP